MQHAQTSRCLDLVGMPVLLWSFNQISYLLNQTVKTIACSSEGSDNAGQLNLTVTLILNFRKYL